MGGDAERGKDGAGRGSPIARVWPAVHRRETGGRGGGGAAAQPHNPANDTTMLETPSPISPSPGFRFSRYKFILLKPPRVFHIYIWCWL